jgi:hypothetical protein
MDFRGQDIFNIISSNAISDDEKSKQLTVIGLEFRLTQIDKEVNEYKQRFEGSGVDFTETFEYEQYDSERTKINEKLKTLKK